MEETRQSPLKKLCPACITKQDSSPSPPLSPSSDKLLSDDAQASLLVKDEKEARRSPGKRVQKKDASSVPLSSSSAKQLDTAQASSSAGDTAQARADVHKEVFVPVRHPTGGARKVPRSVFDLAPSFIHDEELLLPELSKSPMAQMPLSPTAKTPKDSAKRTPSRRPCTQCGPNVSSPGSVCSHITRASRQLEFNSENEPTHMLTGPHYPMFGIRLEDDVADGGQDVPRVVVRCVEIIEKWCEKNKEHCEYTYEGTSFPDQVELIKEDFAKGRHEDFGKRMYNIRSYAEVLKQYLRELPDPVIPEHMYDMFVDVVSGGAQVRERRTLQDLVHDMPPRHRHTLQALLLHFTKMLRWQAESNPEETYMQLIRQVSHILIRPRWSEIEKIGSHIKVYNDMLIELIRAGCWGEVPPNLPVVMPYKLPAPAPREDKRTAFTPQPPAERLRDAPWYWGNLTPEQATDIVMPHPEGSFLVRDSTEPGNYVLMLKISNEVKLIKIVCKDDECGFVEPLEYQSVVTLIHWHRNHSLSPYNETLNTKLLHPIMVRSNQENPEASIDERMQELFSISQLYRKRRAMYFYLHKWESWLISNAMLKYQVIGAYDELIKMFQERIKSHQGKKPSADAVNRSRCDNITKLQNRMQDDVKENEGQVKQNNGDMATLKEVIIDLKRDLYGRLNWLKKQGHTQDYIDKLANLDESLWLVDCQRAEAETRLSNTRTGTFLIRPKPEDDIHVLSIMHNGKVGHIKILYQNNFYGFTTENLIFTSLLDLVDYHHYRSLHDKLQLFLLFPVTIDKLGDAKSESERKQQPQAAYPQEPETEL